MCVWKTNRREDSQPENNRRRRGLDDADGPRLYPKYVNRQMETRTNEREEATTRKGDMDGQTMI